MTIWEKLKTYINNCADCPVVAGVIYRQDIIKLNLALGSYTIDGYRRALQVAGYLDTLKPGVYKILKKIPDDLTKTQLYWIAYPEAMQRQVVMRKMYRSYY